MVSFVAGLFDTDDFPARWHCGNWTSGHGWLHIGSDVAVWLAYFAIPCILVFFASRKRDLPFRNVFWLFGAFILACGTTHLMEAIIFWWPAYRLAGVIKLLTAIVSWATVIALVPIVPQALAMRSPESLERDVRQRTAELHHANEALRREVAERRHAENALREQQQLLRVTLSSIGDAVIATDPHGHITFINPAAENFTGWTAAEAATRPLSTIFRTAADDDSALAADPLQRAFSDRSGIGLVERTTLISRDGRRTLIEDNFAPIRDQDGLIRGVVLVFHDVTERRRVEQRTQLLAGVGEALVTLVESEDALRQVARRVVSHVADWCQLELLGAEGVVEHDVRAHADPQWEAALQAAPRKVAGLVASSATVLTGDPTVIGDTLSLQLAGESDAERLTPRHLIRVPLAVRGREMGSLTMALTGDERSYTSDDAALAEELARRTATAVENSRLYKELQDADRRKNEFLAMLAHELRNPLAPVRNALLVLNDSPANEATRRELQQIMINQVDHMVRLVDDLLDVSRIMRGKIELRIESIRIADVIERAVQTVQPLYDENQLKLQVQLPQEPVRVKGDVVRLSQVVSNLLHNAGKYSPRGSTVELRVEMESQGVAVRIRDKGMGIEPETLPKIFDLFTQSARTVERAGGGLGIGLTVVRSIVDMHGGTVEAHSAGLDRGSEFVVRLAVDQSVDEPVGKTWKPQTMSPLRILVVEDNVGSAKTLGLMLKKFWNHEVELAYDGLQGLEIAADFCPDLILMDIGLPNLNGYEVAARMRALPATAETTIVALTGYGQTEDRRRSREVGFDEHLVKPVAVDVLEAVFAKVHNKRRTDPVG